MESNQNPTGPTRKSIFRRLLSWRGLIFILACIITLIALVHAEENWRGGRAWKKYRKELAANGQILEESKLIPPPIPDDQNFAMIPFLKSMYDYLPGTQTRRDTNALVPIEAFEKLSNQTEDHIRDLAAAIKDPNRKAEQRELATAVLNDLSKKTEVIEQFRVASHERPNCRFNVAYDYPDKIAILLPHLQVVRTTCRILSARAHAELVLGQTDAALNDCMLAIYLGECIRTEPFLISALVRCASVRYAMAPIKHGLLTHAWNDNQISQLQQALANVDIIEGLKVCFRGELYVFTDTFLDRVKADRGQLSMLSTMNTDAPQVGGWGSRLLLNIFIPRGWVDLEQVNCHRIFNDTILDAVDPNQSIVYPDVSKRGADQMTQLAGKRFDAFLHHRTLALWFLPAVINCCQKPAFAQDEINMTIIACALERHRLAHGSFPNQLNALVPDQLAKVPSDVIKGQPFKYSAANGEFKLYSVGWNETDDNGTIVKNKGSSGNQKETEGDWVFGLTP